MKQLLEERPIPEIRAFFAAKGLELVVHTDPPPQPTKEELRRMPREVRRARVKDTSTHWVALGTVARYYGSGNTEESAIRSAARRYRVEQADPEASRTVAHTHSIKTMVRCRNLAASRSFYVDLLGLQVVEEWDEAGDRGFVVGFGPGGGFLEMLAVDPHHPRHEPGLEGPAANDKIELQIRVDSVDDWARRLAGDVEIEGPVTRPWGNRYLWIRDPDGVRIAIFEGPGE